MSNLISHVHVILQDVAFATWESRFGDVPSVGFEDQVLMGFVCIFETPDDLLSRWRHVEAEFLARYSPNFRRAGEKAWNVYCVFLSSAPASDAQRRSVSIIEEDLERTRKITGTGLSTQREVENALLPLLPIVSKPVLEPEDPIARLRRRINSIAPGAEVLVLDPSVTPDAAARALGQPA